MLYDAIDICTVWRNRHIWCMLQSTHMLYSAIDTCAVRCNRHMCCTMQSTHVLYDAIDTCAVRCNINACAEWYNRLALYDTLDIRLVSLFACCGILRWSYWKLAYWSNCAMYSSANSYRNRYCFCNTGTT